MYIPKEVGVMDMAMMLPVRFFRERRARREFLDKQWREFSASRQEDCHEFYFLMERFGQKPRPLWGFLLDKRFRSKYGRPCFTIHPPGRSYPPFFHVFEDGSLFLSGTRNHHFNTIYPGIAEDLSEALKYELHQAKVSVFSS